MNQAAHIKQRRQELRDAIAYQKDFEAWEETCVPSYCHPNRLAALVSWRRLFAAADAAKKSGPPMRHVLDFGSSIGELGHLLPKDAQYDVVEEIDAAANFLAKQLPHSKRVELDAIAPDTYDHIFAIDSLEHNANYAELLEILKGKLKPGGVLILSGPTENWLYKLGRKIAGFEGHYHETNIHAIEAAAAKLFTRRSVKSIVPLVPLFRVTAWEKTASGQLA